MKNFQIKARLIRVAVLVGMCATSQSAFAAQLSPWMGSDDQAPFQLDPITMVAVTFAADPLQTGSTTKAACPLTGCVLPPKTAIEPSAESGSPQN